MPYGAPYKESYVNLKDWPDPPQGGTALKNKFITLQVARKLIFEHPDWKKRFPECPKACDLHCLEQHFQLH